MDERRKRRLFSICIFSRSITITAPSPGTSCYEDLDRICVPVDIRLLLSPYASRLNTCAALRRASIRVRRRPLRCLCGDEGINRTSSRNVFENSFLFFILRFILIAKALTDSVCFSF